MQLYLVRHGKAETGEVDYRRRLTERGRSDVEHQASILHKARVQVDRVEHSGLIRAEETATILARAIDSPLSKASYLAPDASVHSAAQAAEGSGCAALMLVGHLPFMERLASYLLIRNAEASILHFRTATIACLSDELGAWMVEWLMPARLG